MICLFIEKCIFICFLTYINVINHTVLLKQDNVEASANKVGNTVNRLNAYIDKFENEHNEQINNFVKGYKYNIFYKFCLNSSFMQL